ncbi:uncharacterized protein C1orf158 homolog [Lingula anatina]|uniref:Uncharacterized protein C1orf158 homolog n=1 Tax=Lingula anatina TaxID=7574 RepID=A0A1S3J1F4_LINAN|nr:uncharacterized protein C1orf158 homolog [Lingula anatina]|eukprot:XP_013404083.1 uncharacterized protein C1orf158 homolog [Lingula anatina]
MSHGDPLKWGMPGWRIEQKYADGVLIGNWAEQRYTFDKGNYKHNSTHRMDFKNYEGAGKPDVIIRRQAMLKNEGLGKEMLFTHHGNKYSNNMISWYDEHYNKRERPEWNKLPELRDWDGHKLAWAPEKTDYPLQGDATNFGLYQTLQNKWREQQANATKGDYYTNYQLSHTQMPKESYVRVRYGNPRDLSTSLHKNNKVNKDLHLRSSHYVQQPEGLAAVSM